MKLLKIKDADLCSGCGTCVGICPTGALRIKYGPDQFPEFDEKKCINCGRCSYVCPGKGADLRRLISERGSRFNNLLGYYERIYYGHSSNEKLRIGGASGGIATNIMLYLLENKKVDYVSLVKWNDSRPEIVITNDRKEIISGMKSKYCYIPLNTLIPKILKVKGKVAVVGTPCQIMGLVKACDINKKLAEKIYIKIGLMCGYAQDYDAITAIKTQVWGSQDCRFVGWREKPYPGYLVCTDEISKKKTTIYNGLDVVVPFYTMRRCLLCEDGANELSDIVLGDVHSKGSDTNIIISRTKTAENILSAMKKDGQITLEIKGPEEITKGGLYNILKSKRLKTRNLNSILKLFGSKVPKFGIRQKKSIYYITISLFQYLLIRYLTKHRKFYEKRPRLQRFLGHFVYRFPSTVPGFKFFAKRLK